MSVVVATRNRAGRLRDLFDALRTQTYPPRGFEVIVVDDASSDGTAGLLAREARRGDLALEVISRASSGGAAVGREQGWRRARAGVIAFTDDDCVPDREWLAAGLRTCAAAPGAIVQGRTLPRPDELDRLGPFSRTMEVKDLDHAFQTTNIFYPRSLLERVGGFDTEAFEGSVGGEDTDLAWRAIEAGAETVFCPEALVHHAVNELGPLGKLRVAARSTAVVPYARHARIRREHFVHGVFRKPTHYWLALALTGLALPRRWRPLGAMLAIPYVRSLHARGKLEGGGPMLAPYFVVHDLVEVYATVRGGARMRRFLL